MCTIFYFDTNVGKKRENNEDYLLTYSLENDAKIYIVLDGIGGANSGEVASSLAANKVLEYIKEHFNEEENIKNIIMAVKYANRCVYEKNKQDKAYKDMGTTISLMYTEKKDVYIINIGDSRIYEIEDKKIKQLTEDDTYVNALVKDNVITKEEALSHPERHVLLRAVGVSRSITVEVKEYKNIAAKSFLLCTDGLTNMLTDIEIFNVIKSNEDTKELICKELVKLANKKGGIDNITVMYVEI